MEFPGRCSGIYQSCISLLQITMVRTTNRCYSDKCLDGWCFHIQACTNGWCHYFLIYIFIKRNPMFIAFLDPLLLCINPSLRTIFHFVIVVVDGVGGWEPISNSNEDVKASFETLWRCDSWNTVRVAMERMQSAMHCAGRQALSELFHCSALSVGRLYCWTMSCTHTRTTLLGIRQLS